jgi:hypothetical protein
LRVVIVDTHGFGHLVFAHLDEARRASMDRFYDVGDRLARGNTISKRAGCRSVHGFAGIERERRGRRVHRAYADYLGLQSEQIPHGDESTDSGAHSDTDIHRIEPLNRAEQLQRVARNASDEIPVEGGNEVQVLSGGDAMCLVLGFVESFPNSTTLAPNEPIEVF